MKICLLNDSFPPVIDGVVNVVMNYADYLIRDHEAGVIVGTPRYPEADYSVYPYPVVPYRSFDTAGITSGYRTGNPFQEKAVSELAAFAPDLIHAHCPASATIIARLLREETGAPIVFTYHTKYDIDIERVVRTRLAAREGIRAMVRNIEATDDVWVVSEGAGRSLTALGFQGDWRVMPNGVDFRQGRADPEAVSEVTGDYDLPDGVPVLLFVGRLMTYKGLPLILDALKMLSDAGQDFRMVFVGKGPDRELLEETAANLGLMDTETSPGRKYSFFRITVYGIPVLRDIGTPRGIPMASGRARTSQRRSASAMIHPRTSSRTSGSILGTPSVRGWTKYGYPLRSTTGHSSKLLMSLSYMCPRFRYDGKMLVLWVRFLFMRGRALTA